MKLKICTALRLNSPDAAVATIIVSSGKIFGLPHIHKTREEAALDTVLSFTRHFGKYNVCVQ